MVTNHQVEDSVGHNDTQLHHNHFETQALLL